MSSSNLYVVLDLFSRYPVAWMVAERENAALAKQLFAEAISRYDIEPGNLIVHQDRGAPTGPGGAGGADRPCWAHNDKRRRALLVASVFRAFENDGEA